MSESTQEKADRLFEEALEASGGRDPREFYRERLRELREANPSGYDEAVGYFKDVLLPGIADKGEDPLESWLTYGCKLAEWTNPGQPVAIDPTGRSEALERPAPADRLILHLPKGKGRAIVIGIPPELSPAQRATYALLVQGKQKLQGAT